MVLYTDGVRGNLRRYGRGDWGVLSVVLQHVENKLYIFLIKFIIIFYFIFKYFNEE